MYSHRVLPHRTATQLATVTADVAGCVMIVEASMETDTDTTAEDLNDRGLDLQLPPILKKWGIHKIREACRCLPKPPTQTVTQTIVGTSEVRFSLKEADTKPLHRHQV